MNAPAEFRSRVPRRAASARLRLLPFAAVAFFICSRARVAAQAHYVPYSFETMIGLEYLAQGSTGLVAGAVDSLYVQNNGITRISADGQVRYLNLGPRTQTALAVDRDGNFYSFSWVGSGAGSILKITSDGAQTTLATLPNATTPYGMAVGLDGTLYFSTGYGRDVRKIAPGGTVTVLAGQYQVSGSVDGIGTAATFNAPMGLALDSAGNLYVADQSNNNIRKISPGGIVTTFAGGDAGMPGYADGPRLSARFKGPTSLAFDRNGNLFVADSNNQAVRVITVDGMVSTIGGIPGDSGNADGVGPSALFTLPSYVAADSAGVVYVMDALAKTVRKGIAQPSVVIPAVSSVPVIATEPSSQTVFAGQSVSLFVAAVSATSYQWMKAGVPVPGATSYSLTLSNVQADSAGTYSVVVANAAGSITSSSATLTVITTSAGATSRLSNLSMLSDVGQVLTAGFAVSGGAGKKLLIRASGPSLAGLGVARPILDPVLTLWRGQTLLAQNDNWDPALTTDFASVGAFSWQPGSKDAAVVVTLDTGGYTVQVSDKNGGAGTALIEIYDEDSLSSFTRLLNVSAQSLVSSDGQTAGFVIDGDAPKKVVVRAAGPSLSKFGVANPLADPTLALYSGQTILAQNDDWDASLAPDFVKVGAFEWLPGSRDAAIVIVLQPSTYTARVRGKNGTSGTALLEVYQEP